MDTKGILIVAGESSGELYGALLARELMSKFPGVKVFGVGWERMKGEGVEVFREVSGAFGLVEAVSSVKGLKETMRELLRRVDESPPALAVLIDFPDFNFQVAAKLKKRGIKVLYYVSPQVWAWRAGRLKKMGRIADKVALVLPFEEELYRKHDIPAEFVGHPVMDEIAGLQAPDKRQLGLDEKKRLLAVLPGSRHSELERHLPLMADTLGIFLRQFPDWQVLIPLAPNLKVEPFKQWFKRLRAMGVVIKKVNALGVLAVSDAAIVASGTATLQAALLEKPFVVVYKLSPFTYFVGKRLVNVKFICLANILLGKQVVKELLQKDASPEAVMAEMRRLIGDPDYTGAMLGGFREIKKKFSGRNASLRTAEIVGEMTGWG